MYTKVIFDQEQHKIDRGPYFQLKFFYFDKRALLFRLQFVVNYLTVDNEFNRQGIV